METATIDKDISVFYITASSYPEGILDAHKNLHSMVPFTTSRRYYGLSRPENGTIVYRAAAEELWEGEGKKLKCDTIVIKKGKYICSTVHDYMKHVHLIKDAFDELLESPELDPQGYCVEWYVSEKDVKCMIRLKQ